MRGIDTPATDAPAPEPSRYCPACAYDLRAIASDRCPECGTEIDHAYIAATPWVHRKRIGHVRAFWKTVFTAIRHPSRIASDIAADVDYRSAVRFRFTLTNWLYCTVLLPAMIAGIVDIYREYDDVLRTAAWSDFFINWSVIPLLAASLWFGLFMMLGAQGYFFHPRSLPIPLQNRAIALSEYACAPLGLIPLAIPFFAVASAMTARRFSPYPEMTLASAVSAAVAGFIVMAGLIGGAIAGPVLLWRTTTCPGWRVILYVLTMPVIYSVAFCLPLLVPATYLFVLLVKYAR